ncbi:uncharacterized protein LOC134826243 isoform X2 [Bolinopsis microptera]|uniref:uncharacterized protein LOC134826243 isoform X2 n=1 Tax=Bolinopsis microptera TaxID=2820187 RepID=UPI003079D596
MNDLKLGFVVNTVYGKDGHIPQQIHLLIVRILLYYCYTPKINITWGYHLFRSGILNISYRKISLQSIALKPAQKLLSDLTNSFTVPCVNKTSTKTYQNGRTPLEGGVNEMEGSDLLSRLDEEAEKEVEMTNRSWEEALTMVASDFNWDDDTDNLIFVLSSSLIGDSDRIRTILSSLKKDKKVKLVTIDTNALEGSRSSIDQEALDKIIHGRYSRQKTCIVPTDLLCSDLSKFCFRQIFRSHLTNHVNKPAQKVKFIGTETILVLDDSSGEENPAVDDGDMEFALSPMDQDMDDRGQFISLMFKMEVSYSFAGRYLDHRNCYFVAFDEKFAEFTTPDWPSFSVESVEVKEDKKYSNTYVIKHLTPTVGVMFSLLALADPSDLVQLPRTPEEECFDLISFHDLGVDENSADLFIDVSSQFRMSVSDLCLINNTTEKNDSHMMEQIKNFHDLHIKDPFVVRSSSKPDDNCEPKRVCKVEDALATIPEITADCALDEAMLQSSPRSYERANIAALVRKYQNDVKQELQSPSKLKEKHSDDSGKLVKEHKIQVVLHLVWYCEFSDMETEEKDCAASGVLALLRSLSFLTSPTQMFNFLNDQILKEFHEDCQDLLRELYEDGFLMEVPDILCDDSNSLSSSVLSTHHAQAPLYCEDTSNSQSNDATISSQSTFTRHRSWMDPCQSSQSSFSISVPKHKKKKKKHREYPGKVREHKIAAKVCSKKQVGVEVGRSKYLSSEITPDEVKQSSKRRKLSRKNSILDTPLKKQVKNPTAAKTSRARQRVDLTPQKECTSVSQIQESPVRATSGRASSFFGSQSQNKSLKTFAIKDGFKTPNRPVFNLKTTPSSSTEDIPSLFRSPDQVSNTPPRDSNSQHSNTQNSNTPNSNSQHSFTPPGTPRSGRKFVKKILYNSPMRALFVTGSQFSPKRKPLDSDYIQMKGSPSRSMVEKENEPFFPTLKHFDNSSDPKLPQSDFGTNTLEPIIHPRVNEDAQMPTFQSSPYQGTINIQSKGGFLKLLEESNSMSHGMSYGVDKKRDSDNESDVSAVSVSSFKSILKSPFTSGKRKKRTVSFSLDLETPFSSDNESEITGTDDFCSLLNLVDGSIKSDEIVNTFDMFGCESLSNHSSQPQPGSNPSSQPKSENNPSSKPELGIESSSKPESGKNLSSKPDVENFGDVDCSMATIGSDISDEGEYRKRKRSESPS